MPSPLTLSPEFCRGRQSRLVERMRQLDLDRVVVQQPENVQWLTGFRPHRLMSAAAALDIDGHCLLAAPNAPPESAPVDDCITFEGLLSPRAWTFAKGKSDVSVEIHSRLIVNTAEAAIDAAIAGVGVTRVLSYQIANAIRAGTLAITLQEFEAAPWPISLVYAGQGLLPLKLRAFLDFAAPRLKARLSQDAALPLRPATPLAFLVHGTRQAD